MQLTVHSGCKLGAQGGGDVCHTHSRAADGNPPGFQSGARSGPRGRQRGRDPPASPRTQQATEDYPAGTGASTSTRWRLGQTLAPQRGAGGEGTPGRVSAEAAALTAHVGPKQAGTTLRGAASASSTCPAPSPPFPSCATEVGLKEGHQRGKRKSGVSIGPLPPLHLEASRLRSARILALDGLRRAITHPRPPRVTSLTLPLPGRGKESSFSSTSLLKLSLGVAPELIPK